MSTKLAPSFPWNRGGMPRRTMLRRGHPYNAGYALPKNVLDESTSGGSLVTRQAKSGTISGGSFGGQGYAVPNYILAEPWRGARPSAGLPRGTIANVVSPQFIESSLGYNSLGYWGEGTLSSIGSGLKRGAKMAGSLAGKLAKTACKISSNELAQKAGGPYVAMVNGVCPAGSQPAAPPTGTTVINQGISPTTMMIGAAALVTLLLVIK